MDKHFEHAENLGVAFGCRLTDQHLVRTRPLADTMRCGEYDARSDPRAGARHPELRFARRPARTERDDRAMPRVLGAVDNRCRDDDPGDKSESQDLLALAGTAKRILLHARDQ